MADQASDYHRGEMEIGEQVATYSFFMGLTKWGSLALAALLLWLTLWFSTDFGFMGATGAAVAVTVVGIVLLREKKTAH